MTRWPSIGAISTAIMSTARGLVDPRRRLRLSFVCFAALCGRADQSGATRSDRGAAFRREAARPLRRVTGLPATAGEFYP